MAICRFSSESDVYIVPISVGHKECWSCMACHLLDTAASGEEGKSVELETPDIALEHLKQHQRFGHKVITEAFTYFALVRGSSHLANRLSKSKIKDGRNESNRDPFGLARFLDAQADVYAVVLSELRRGRKQTHWIWFIFPQLAGLGMSETSVLYAIKSLDEAKAYLAHPVLGHRLTNCAAILLQQNALSARAIVGSPDDQKLRSCMTLFSKAAEAESIFNQVLAKYFDGIPDDRTLEILGQPDLDDRSRA